MDHKLNPIIELNNGQKIPQVGLGVYKLAPEAAEQLVGQAIETGYRRIDTAAFYGNEVEIGAGVRNCGLPREEVFVTTKIWNDDQGYDRTLKAIELSLERLDLGYIDMLLIHWPKPSLDLFIETWAAFQEAVKVGTVRGIGVSNFEPWHLEKLLAAGGTVPAINQVELHPGLQQVEVRKFDTAHGIATEAWSPLARGRFLDDPVIKKIAAKHNCTGIQVIVRWHIELGNLVIPKTATASRLEENISVFDFQLDQDDIDAIATLDSGIRTGPSPDEF